VGLQIINVRVIILDIVLNLGGIIFFYHFLELELLLDASEVHAKDKFVLNQALNVVELFDSKSTYQGDINCAIEVDFNVLGSNGLAGNNKCTDLHKIV
jgi:hypothetical protein